MPTPPIQIIEDAILLADQAHKGMTDEDLERVRKYHRALRELKKDG